jgi:hypothetical protein
VEGSLVADFGYLAEVVIAAPSFAVVDPQILLEALIALSWHQPRVGVMLIQLDGVVVIALEIVALLAIELDGVVLDWVDFATERVAVIPISLSHAVKRLLA